MVSLFEDLFNLLDQRVLRLTEFGLDLVPLHCIIVPEAAENELEQDLLKISNVPLDLVHNAVFLEFVKTLCIECALFEEFLDHLLLLSVLLILPLELLVESIEEIFTLFVSKGILLVVAGMFLLDDVSQVLNFLCELVPIFDYNLPDFSLDIGLTWSGKSLLREMTIKSLQ